MKLIYECIDKKEAESKQDTFETDFNVRLHDSDITNEDIYKQLELVDLESAKKIHFYRKLLPIRLPHGLQILRIKISHFFSK